MSATINSAGIVFGDGTIQTTKTPSNISSFTNDSGYLTSSTVNTQYAKKSETGSYFSVNNTGYGITVYLKNIDGTAIYGGGYNCNCNC